MEINKVQLETEGMTEESIAAANKKLDELKVAAKEEVDALDTIEAVEAYNFDVREAVELLVTIKDQEAQNLAAAKESKKDEIEAVNLTKEETAGMTEESIKTAKDILEEAKNIAKSEVQAAENIDVVKNITVDKTVALEALVTIEDQEAKDLEEAKKVKKAKITTEVPADIYTKNKEAYDSKVQQVKSEIDALETVKGIESYDIGAQFVGIKTDAEIEAEEALAEAINAAESAIKNLPEEISLEDESVVIEARTLVNTALELDADAKIEGLEALESAEATIEQLTQAAAELAKAIESAESAIKNLPEEITLEDEETVLKARGLVNQALELDADAKIKGIESLKSAEATIEQLNQAAEKLTKAINAAENAIDSLPEEITLEHEEDVLTARGLVDTALELDSNAKIKGIESLKSAEATIEQLTQAAEELTKAINAAESAIKNLPEEISLEDESVVIEARTLVNTALELDADAKIEGIETLESAEERWAELVFDNAKEQAKLEIKESHPKDSYTKNKEDYINAISKIDEAENIKDVETKKEEVLEIFETLYTDADLSEIASINNEFIELMDRTVTSAGKVGKNKDIAKYEYDLENRYYHIMINPEKNSTGGLGLMGTGIATGLLNFFTTGDKDKGNLQEELVEVTVVNLTKSNSSKTYSYKQLHSANTSFFGAITAINYFIPEGKPLVIGSTVEENYKLIYKYRLSSGRDYNREEEVYFSNEY